MYRVYVYSGASGPDSPRRAVDKTRGEEPPSTHEERERERDQKSPWRWVRKWNRFSAHIIGSRFDWAPL